MILFLYCLLQTIIEIGLVPFLLLLALISRYINKPIDVGLGPEPIINNVYHKQALFLFGYTSQTFVSHTTFITDKFDIRCDRGIFSKPAFPFRGLIAHLYLYLRALFQYKCLYIYFHGGPIGVGRYFLWRIEPFLYKLAKIKVVVMPYGSDVQEMSRSSNLLHKTVMAAQYPLHRFRRSLIKSKIDLWTKYADHIIAGCEWVDYMYHWDTLMLAHFAIDTELWKPRSEDNSLNNVISKRNLKILHAPNHRILKGTQFFIDAVKELKNEGFDIDIVLLEKASNDEVKKQIESFDLIADQLCIGWYAMFALEAMAMGKPVLCYLRDDLMELYLNMRLLTPNEMPILNCSPLTLKDVLRDLATNKINLDDLGRRSRQFVLKHHSLEAVGKVFDNINRSIRIYPKAED